MMLLLTSKTSLAVRAGYAIIRPDLTKFTKTILSRWLWHGFWPAVNHTWAQPTGIKVQCSEEMMDLEIEKDLESEIMLCQVA